MKKRQSQKQYRFIRLLIKPIVKPISKVIGLCLVLVGLFIACNSSQSNVDLLHTINDAQAAVTAVSCIGQANNYTLSVTIESPDTGCDQYADWWEVFTPDGVLIYRRILGHSHIDEQPFTRSGGPVNIGPNDSIYVRAHMNNLGYGTLVYSGTIGQELNQDIIDTDFAMELETMSPLPENCAF